MKITGIIAEYNPFHKGHAYHLRQAALQTQADYLVVVLSGDFVQRGAPALTDQHTRAHMALACGADLVLSLPSAYACASAETFAGGAVSLLDGLGCVDALCFGSECGDLSRLLPYALALAQEPPAYRELLRAFLKQGCSFPLARSKALHEYFSYTEDILPCSLDDNTCRYESALLSQPNNTLGIEYLKALMLRKSPIKPCTIARRSAAYHDASLSGELASATAIRTAILNDGALTSVLHQMPPDAGVILEEFFSRKSPVTLDDFSSVLHYKLLSLSRDALGAYTDVSPDLAARIGNLLPQYRSASSFADRLKTRQITHPHVTRALCHILLEDKQEDARRRKALQYPVYARVLGFRRESQPLLTRLKQMSRIPVLGRLSGAEELLAGLTPAADTAVDPGCPFRAPRNTSPPKTTSHIPEAASQPPDAKTALPDAALAELPALLRQDLSASHIYEAMVTDKSGTAFCHEYMRPVLIV